MPQIDGNTEILAHIGLPTRTFTAPLIYNPWFESRGINAAVVPMGCGSEDYPAFLRMVLRLTNVRGALITMPHKVSTVSLLDRASSRVRIADACNAVRMTPDGEFVGDLFDGEGFVAGLKAHGRTVPGASALVVGAGGVGSAIAASLAGAGVARLGLFDILSERAEALAGRIATQHPEVEIVLGTRDPAGWDIAVNSTPLGMSPGDPLPMDPDRLDARTLVGEVVLRPRETAFLAAARARGCAVQIGTDMLFTQIPAYLEFFGLPAATAEELRAVARLPVEE